MSVLLCSSAELPAEDGYDRWIAVGGVDPGALGLPRASMLPDVPELLERAFEESRDLWWRIGRVLAAQPTAEISHAAACASFGSDFGVMLAWNLLVRRSAAGSDTTLVVCDDPYLFRHLSNMPGVDAARPPALLRVRLRSGIRGMASRVSVAIRVAAAAIGRRSDAARYMSEAPALVVYGHPGSTSEGHDAYFGDLLARLPEIRRVLHTDCGLRRARELAADDRTASLHAWGSALYAIFCLPWARWRPVIQDSLCREYDWLIRRSAALENGGGGPAMIRWQQHCQTRWLNATKPRAVAWPWENFSWERGLVRSARARNIHTIGYQHTVIGPHQINYSVRSNPDGSASIPDTIVADGPAYRRELIEWDLPPKRVIDGGSFRIVEPRRRTPYDAEAPVFIALSANLRIAARQLDIGRRIADAGMKVVVKQHPMYPVSFGETGGLSRTEAPIGEFRALSCVIYCTGASALDAVLAGVPSVRLRFADQVSIDVLPRNIGGAVADGDEILDFLRRPAVLPDIVWRDLFSPVDYGKWAALLQTACPSAE